MKEKEYIKNNKGHSWILNEDGSIDIWAYESGNYCNGPRCKNCGYGFCHHCQKLPSHECNIKDTIKDIGN